MCLGEQVQEGNENRQRGGRMVAAKKSDDVTEKVKQRSDAWDSGGD